MVNSDVQRSTAESAPAGGGAGGRSFGPGRSLRHAAKVLPEHARAHNRSLVLQTLFHQGAMSRADLSRETGLTRVTISDLIAGFPTETDEMFDGTLRLIEDCGLTFTHVFGLSMMMFEDSISHDIAQSHSAIADLIARRPE